ncbi:ATPase family gene 2 protein like [Verticillium longisporum]|nr:ATPase family gene 2 protein like [Verticillium longisporum]
MVTSKEVTGKVRPVGTWDQSQEKSSLVGAARVWVNKDTLILLTGGVESTKRCWIERTAPAAALEDDAEASSSKPVRRQAVLSCLLDKKVPPNVFLTTDAYREAAGLKLGDQLSIKLCDESSVPAAKSIVLEPLDAVAAKETPNWEHAVWFPLKRAVHVFPGMTFDCTIATYKKRFRVQSVNAETDNIAACSDDPPTLIVPDIPGLAAESKKLNDFLRGFNAPFLHPRHRRSCGIAIHGGHGTGKSNLLDVVAATKWGTVFRAKAQRPSIILIDDLHALIGKDRANSSTIIFKLGQQLDELAEEASTHGALPKVARSTRFQLNIALPIPNLAGREQLVAYLAKHTHAFNPADLDRLMSTAIHLLETRIDPDQQGHALPSTPYVTRADLDAALRCTRPTAMHDINLKPPTIQWSDIGGQDGLKKALKRMIALSTTTDPRVRALIINPPKGLLLYGPPGCSKTMSAQALATESNFNFFAVKGAELLNIIIFFDEIDSIGGQRAGGGGSGGGGGGGGAARSQGSVNMLTTLLTEMDGFESLPGVLILAATNRPEAIDPALLRPGRFDSLVYVGMPTEAGREAILRTYMGKVRSEPGMDFTELARRADGFSGAEMKQICNMASERAVDECLDGIRTGDDSMITFRDIAGAMETMPKGVTAAMLAGMRNGPRARPIRRSLRRGGTHRPPPPNHP